MIVQVQNKPNILRFGRFSEEIAYFRMAIRNTDARDPTSAVIVKLDSGKLESSDGILAKFRPATLQH